MSDSFYDQLIAAGKPRAAEIYLATMAKSGKGLAAVVALSDNPDNKMIKVHCGKLSCRNFTVVARSEARQWFCETHGINTPMLKQIRYKGRIYTPHYIGDDGISFKLKNGNAITLEPSRVEWV